MCTGLAEKNSISLSLLYIWGFFVAVLWVWVGPRALLGSIFNLSLIRVRVVISQNY